MTKKNAQQPNSNPSAGSAKLPVSGGVSMDRIYYVNNCIWYIRQYFDENGHISRKEAEAAAHNLLLHIAAHRR